MRKPGRSVRFGPGRARGGRAQAWWVRGGWAALLVALASGPGPLAARARAAPEDAAPALDLGSHTRHVGTASPEAQAAFDRGLTLTFSFSHHAAEDEYQEAAAADPKLAMAWWGVALVNGPHINFPVVPPDHAAVAWDALAKAQALLEGASPVERALIGALAKRYADPQPDDRRPLDEAYANAMREVWKAYPEDADVATLFAEALMDLRPWDLWTTDGKPQPGTEEIVHTLRRAIELDPRHPGALHYFIHAIEASPHPEEGVFAADRMRGLVPDASHMVHMPAHIYSRVGRWADAALVNVQAIEADQRYRVRYPRPGFYAIYMAHNQHFLAFTAMMRGRSEEAIDAARKMVAEFPKELLDDLAPLVDGYLIFPSEVLMRFGRWEEILKEPEPEERLPLSRAIWRFTRAVALAALHRPEEAVKARDAFREAAARVPPEWTFGNNTAAAILDLARQVLDGEIAVEAKDYDASVAALRAAVALEDQLRYDEPPDWIQPVRHTLGAVLLAAGRPAEAEAVYREDLARWPENGWALWGLARSLHLEGEHEEAKATDARVKAAWADADIPLTTTCLCLPGR